MIILNDNQIRQKVRRIALEIIEQNLNADTVHLVGINNNGLAFARLLLDEIKKQQTQKTKYVLNNVKLNPANPMDHPVELDTMIEKFKNNVVIIIDDVANTGRTLFFACRPYFEIPLAKLQVAALVDRKHKSYPIHVDYVGMSLATTLKNHINVDIKTKDDFQATLF